MSFVHLHVHSNFSFKDATPHPEELLQAAAFYEMPAVAITDHTTLAGAIRFYRAAQGSGVNPIIGTEIELSSGHHLTLLAENLAGYSNLCRLISAIHLAQPGASKPQASLEVLHPFTKHLICLSGCAHSRLSQDLLAGDLPAARVFLGQLAELFPAACYVEMENPQLPHSSTLLRQLTALAEELALPYVAGNNVHFLRPGDHRIRDLLVCMGANITLRQAYPARHPNGERYFKGPRSMQKLFADFPEAITNTLLIAERCQVKLPLGEYHFPHFPLPPQTTASAYLRQLCEEALKERYPKRRKAAKARLDHELAIIEQLGFCEYFLVVWDIVNFARQEGIRCAGRGSAADSLVAYLLRITTADPLEYDLLFERFLNPERQGMPDIDIDFDSNRRDEVLTYVYNKYSHDCVAIVGTVNTFSSRSALREVAKAMAIDKPEVARLARFLPRFPAHRLEDAIATLPELTGQFPKGEPWDTLLHFCTQLNDVPRHLSVHLGGVVISPGPLTDLVPLEWSAKGVIVTQYDKDDVEYLGLVKMDLLGLRILSAISETVASLKTSGTELDLESLPLDDEATYALLRSTKTVGLFQLESPGMRELLGKLQPTSFDDIIANISLMRPGPMQANMVAPFIRRRHGLEAVSYVHPDLEPVLASTYGVIIYQEQVLQVASALAGFSLGQADLLRRFITHDRSPDEIATLENEFIEGALKRGVDEKTAKEVFSQLAAFASYGFNKAHAATFGLTGYYTAYLKAHHPAHFLVALLNNQPMGFYPSRVILHEARLLGIPILPPDIRFSETRFTLEEGAIRVSLGCIAGISEKHSEAIIAAREMRPFTSFSDFISRSKLPLKSLQNLVQIGALRAFGGISTLRLELALAGEQAKSSATQQSLLSMEIREETRTDYPKREQPQDASNVIRELELTGLYISRHPLEYYRPLLLTYEAVTGEILRKLPDGQKVRVGGIIVSKQMPPTKSKQRIIFLTIEDETGLIDVTVLPHAQKKYAKTALGSVLLLVEGSVRRSGPESISVIAERIFDLRRLAK